MAKKLTAEQLAVAAGCTAATVRNLERGDGNVTIRVLGGVADALGVSAATLVRG
jgi:transcriptional regulator with XRE-family HTH domain